MSAGWPIRQELAQGLVSHYAVLHRVGATGDGPEGAPMNRARTGRAERCSGIASATVIMVITMLGVLCAAAVGLYEAYGKWAETQKEAQKKTELSRQLDESNKKNEELQKQLGELRQRLHRERLLTSAEVLADLSRSWPLGDASEKLALKRAVQTVRSAIDADDPVLADLGPGVVAKLRAAIAKLPTEVRNGEEKPSETDPLKKVSDPAQDAQGLVELMRRDPVRSNRGDGLYRDILRARVEPETKSRAELK